MRFRFGILLALLGLLFCSMKTPPKEHLESSPGNQREDETSDSLPLYDGFDGYQRPVTTTSKEAQRWFDQGMQLLYGYNHDEAIRSFEKAAEMDPDCAMHWWGSAYARGLHINNPQMSEEQSRLAFDSVQRALAALDQESPVEQALVRALAKRYQWPAPDDRTSLDQDYANAMESVWHEFPNDPDVSSLFAEALMNLQPWDLWTAAAEPKGRALEIVALLERTLKFAPEHPGANHFYIHAIEASPWPQRGIEAAERLGSLVPGSGHLVHMPSHIFIRTGRYADAVTSNERAILADEVYFKRAPPPQFYRIYFLHNLHFLAYAAMMEGRFQTAMDAARSIERHVPKEFLREYVTIADGLMVTPLHVLIRFGKWQQILDEPQPEEWRLFSRAEWHFARCVAFASQGNTDQAERELELMDQVASQITSEWMVGNNAAHDVLQISRLMAAGELAFHRQEFDAAFQFLADAVKLEEGLRYDEPPGWMQPVRHALGALLLANERLSEAESVYLADLERHPENAWSLLGLETSLRRQGKIEQADALIPRVEQAWTRADVRPKASCYCSPESRRESEGGGAMK